MANRAYFQMLASLVERLTLIQGQFTVGSSGAVSAVQGSGVDSVTHVQTGVYQLQLSDSYNKFLDAHVVAEELAGSPVAITAAANNLTIGVAYTITTLGDATAADWLAVGVPAGIVPVVGVAFVALATGAGTGTTARVAPVAATNTALAQVYNVMGSATATLHTSAPGAGSAVRKAGYLMLVVRSGVGVVTDPPSGNVLKFSLLLRNSSVKGKGE